MSTYRDFPAYVAAALLLALIVVVPIPLGSNRDWAWSPVSLVTGIALVSMGIALLTRKEGSVPYSPSIRISVVGMSVVLAWGLFQATSWGLSYSLTPVLSGTAAALGQTLPGHGAIDPERALSNAMRLATYGGVFWLAAHLGRERRHAAAISGAVIVSALIVTFYGWVIAVTARSCLVLFIEKLPLDGGPTCVMSATFVNPNNYADFASLAALVCLAQLQELVLQSDSSGRGTRARWRAMLMMVGGRGALYLAALVVLVGGIVLSASRSGILSFLAAVAAMTILTAMMRRGRRRNLTGTLIGLGLFIVVPLIASGEHVVRRFLGLVDQGDPDRLHLLDLTLNLISSSPWTGWGLGSFAPLYSVFQPIGLVLSFDQAHNVYLETAADVGIPVAILAVAAVAAPAVRCVLGLRERRRDTQFAAAAFGSAILLALHSLVDFGLQIPAVAVVFAAILGAGWGQSWSSRLKA